MMMNHSEDGAPVMLVSFNYFVAAIAEINSAVSAGHFVAALSALDSYLA